MKEEIGKRIECVRKNMNMNKEDFAKMLGITGQYLGTVEHGKSCLSYEKLKILCDLTHLSADYILFGKNEHIKEETKSVLSEFTDNQIQEACTTLGDLAIFIKNN